MNCFSKLSVGSVLAGVVALAGSLMVGQAQAAPIVSLDEVNILQGVVTMADLTAPAPEGYLYNGILVYDKVFYNFKVAPTPISLSTLSVTPISDPTGTQEGFNTPVWGFKITGAMSSILGQSNTTDLNLDYEVQVAPGWNNVITDAHIKGDPNVFGTGIASVTESWATDDPNNEIAIYKYKLTQDSPANTLLNDGIEFGQGFNHLYANKDINLIGVNGGIATLSYVDQVYSQGTGDIPEPASLGILALGGLALMARRRRRRA